MGENKLTADVLCRTCMCESGNMKSVFSQIENERTLTDLLAFTTNIVIRSDDSLPKQVCVECQELLCKADAFKRRCLDVESKLANIFDVDASLIFSKIKPENSAIKATLDADEPYQCSICLNKYADIILLENHVNNYHKQEVPLLNGMTLFSHTKRDILTLETIPEKEENVEMVKEEFNLELENSCDNNYTESNDSEFIDYSINDNHKLITNETSLTENKCNKTDDELISDKRKKKQYTCEKCDLKFKSASSLTIHKNKHNKDTPKKSKEIEKKHQCSLCMRKFMKKASLTNHLQTHKDQEDKKYCCGSCGREFKHKAHLDNHMVTLHGNEKGFSCDFCLKNFATQESLDIHRDLHKVDKKHTCEYCNKSFYMLSTLTDHIRIHTGEKPYLCATCGRGFSQKTNLAQHMRRHLGLKQYACEQCDQRFVSKGELVAHTRKHSGAHPFKCGVCFRGFTTSSSLVKHKRTHSGERPYSCDLCDMRFAASGTLKNHRRTHTGEKPYQCSYCEKAFVQKNDLVSHIRCHTGERPFICTVCGSSFRKASALRSHAKMHGTLMVPEKGAISY